MALEDLTGTKYLDALVPTNPIADDDRREGDDHLRGLKNVLRNTFPNLNGAVTLTDEQLNGFVAGIAAALLKANNLSDVLSAFTSRQNLGLHDVNGHWGVPATLDNVGWVYAINAGNAEINLGLLAARDSGEPQFQIYNAVSGHVGEQFRIALTSSIDVLLGATKANGALSFMTGGTVHAYLSGSGTLSINPASANHGIVVAPLGGGWGLWIDGGASGSSNAWIFFQPGSSGAKYCALTVDTDLTNPLFSIAAQGSGGQMQMAAGSAKFWCWAGDNTARVSGPSSTSANDSQAATTAFVNANAAGSRQRTWQNVVGSRVLGSPYTSPDYPIEVIVNFAFPATSGTTVWLEVASSQICVRSNGTAGAYAENVSAVLPPGTGYKVNNSTGTPTINSWWELR